MVQVPVTTRNAIGLQPLGNERLRYTQARDFVGPAITGFGEALGQAARDIDAIEATYDEADATRIANEYGNYERERLRTGDNAYLTTQGFDAGNGREAAVTDLQKGAENLLTGARSERARAMAKRALDVKLGNAQNLIAEHAVGQMKVARDEQSQSRIDGAITDAIDSRGTDQFAVNLGVAQMELEQLGRRSGWSPEQLKDKQTELTSNAYARTVLAIDAEDGEPTRALDFLEQNKGLISPADEAKLRNSLNPRVDAAWARSEIGSIVDSYVAVPTAKPGAAGEPVSADPLRGAGHVVSGGQFGAKRSYGGHTGVDYAAAPGTPIHPTGAGVVTRAYTDPAYGNRVEIDHGNGIVTTYSHMASLNVKPGERVTPDMVIGGVGNTGSASHGNHVHYETLLNGRKVDPSSIPAGAPGVPADPRLNSQNVQSGIEAYIAAHPEIPERRAEALRAAGDEYVRNARADRAQAEQDADRRVMDWLTRNKPGADDLTSLGQIPASILAGASPSALASLQDRVQATQARIQSRNDAAAKQRADDIAKFATFELYTMSDAELANTDLSTYIGRIPMETLGPWFARKQRAAQGKATVSADRIASAIDSYGKPFGASRAPDANADQKAAWMALRGYVEQRTAGRGNADVSNEDLRGLVAGAMTQVVVPESGWLRDDRKRYMELAPGEQFVSRIPTDTKRQIEGALRIRLNREPTGAEVWEAYQAGKARGLFQ